MNDKELQKYISDIKRDLLTYIITDLREKKITFGEAKYLAKDFLAMLPAKDKRDVLNKLYSLTKIYKEAQIVFSKYFSAFEEEETVRKLDILREYMQRGDYDHAVYAMRGGN